MSTNTPGATIAVTGAFATSPAYSGTFIPQVWSTKLQVKFYDASTFSAISNTDYQGEIKGMGDKVIIRTVPDITVADYVVGSTLTYQVPASANIELNIDKAKSYQFQLSDVLDHQADIGLMDMFSNDASEQMRTVIDRECFLATFNQGDAANFGATAGKNTLGYNLGTDNAPFALTPANILPLITSMSAVLDEQNIPSEGRYLVISPFDRQILMQSNLANAQFIGDSQSILRNGRIGMIDRFEVFVSNLLPTANAGQAWGNTGAQGGAAKRRAILFGHTKGTTFASQIVKMESIRNPSDFGDLVRGLQVYGRKVVFPKGIGFASVI